MRLHLAGTYSRDFILEEIVRLYLSAINGGKKIEGDFMNLYLAGEHTVKNGAEAHKYVDGVYLLESYFYIRKNKFMPTLLPILKGFLLDSGAFTFMQTAGPKADFERYIEEYAEFIKQHNVKHFFELDIDSIVGLAGVEKLRARLEKLVGRRCIPVWHKSRGKDYWHRLCAEYDYVAIGGIVTKEIQRFEYPFFNYFLEEAVKTRTKVHGLGFTNLEGLKKYPFHSVDSTSWLFGNRSGHICRFDGTTIKKIASPPGTRLKSREVAVHNFLEWIKFQRYMEVNL